MKKFFQDFRLVDSKQDFVGSLLLENDLITAIFPSHDHLADKCRCEAAAVFSGDGRRILTPGFIDIHAHFRDPGFPAKETLESACLAAVRGGWTTAVCMANTMPPLDTAERAAALRSRAAALGIIDLYPVLSLTTAMDGREVSRAFQNLHEYTPRLFSEDGKDIERDDVFKAALEEAARLKIPVSCHCDIDGEATAVQRALRFGRESHCHLHIAHVSTRKACELIRKAKQSANGFNVSVEATPHHIALNAADAEHLGASTFGKVAPPLRNEDDRRAVIEALQDGTIDAIATDHAPHTRTDKEKNAPGFIGLETAFSVVNTILQNEGLTLSDISRLLSSGPAAILNLHDRGVLEPGKRAHLVVLDAEEELVITENFS
ncbi:MAG: amidohydrolase family protein, partial [Spirochaetaceae bacterium]|nr:amidohydrolase family protein [Spirochaetaceae bacterium]